MTTSTGQQLLRAYMRGETIWAVSVVASAAFLLRQASTQAVLTAHDPLGPRFFPVASSALLLLAALVLLAKPLVRVLVLRRPAVTERTSAASALLPSADDGEESTSRGPLARPAVRVVAMTIVSVSYVTLIDTVGFIPATILAMAGTMVILGASRVRSFIIAPAATTLVVYYIFVNMLHVRLP